MEKIWPIDLGLAPRDFSTSPELVENFLGKEDHKTAGESVGYGFLQEVRRKVSPPHPLYNPRVLAPLRNVLEIIEEPANVSGRLVPVPGGFRMYLDGKQPETRRRFSCAHELGHTFFYDISQPIPQFKATTFAPDSKPIESFCDGFAVGLLMPRDLFRKSLTNFEKCPRLSTMKDIAATFGTSLEATYYRLRKLIVSTPEHVMFTMFSREPNRHTGRREKFRVKTSITPKGFVIFPNASAESLGLGLDGDPNAIKDNSLVLLHVWKSDESGKLKRVKIDVSQTVTILSVYPKATLLVEHVLL